jgi:hypothetical protein
MHDELDAAGCLPRRNGFQITGLRLQEAYKDHMRKPLNDAFVNYTKSGNGDGGPVPVGTAAVVYSSRFTSFCCGSIPLVYMHKVFIHHALLFFATSSMPVGTTHNSASGSNTVGPSPLTGPGGSSGKGKDNSELVSALKNLFNEDGAADVNATAKRKAEAEVAQARAKGAALDLAVKQEAALDALYVEYDGLDKNSEDSRIISKRVRLKARILSLEADLTHDLTPKTHNSNSD